jgi:hypothetical protein
MATVEQIIDNAILNASNLSNRAVSYSEAAFNQATGAPSLITTTLADSPSVREPNVFIPSRAAGADTALWDSVYGRIINDLTNRFRQFFDEYFPIDPALMAAVENWLTTAITTGGTGINTTVENRIWQRDRDRITAESMTNETAAVSGWAARGFPLPPGAAVGAVQQIRASREIAVAAVSRDAAIKAFDTEIENVRFAITNAIDYRTKAIAAAGDYIRALALAPQIATQLATSESDAQARLISAAAGFYNARINEAELIQRNNIAQLDYDFKALIQTAEDRVKYTQMRVQALEAAAQSLGQQASAALNGVNSTVQKIASE